MRHMTDVSIPNFLVFRALQSWFEMLVYIKSVTLPTMLSWGDVLAHDTIHLIVTSNLPWQQKGKSSFVALPTKFRQFLPQRAFAV